MGEKNKMAVGHSAGQDHHVTPQLALVSWVCGRTLEHSLFTLKWATWQSRLRKASDTITGRERLHHYWQWRYGGMWWCTVAGKVKLKLWSCISVTLVDISVARNKLPPAGPGLYRPTPVTPSKNRPIKINKISPSQKKKSFWHEVWFLWDRKISINQKKFFVKYVSYGIQKYRPIRK